MQNIESLIEQAAKAHPKLTPLVDIGLDGIIPGIVVALTFQAKQWSHGNEGLNPKDNLLTEPTGEGFVNLRFGFSHMGIMEVEHSERYVKIVHDVLEDLESRLRDWEEYRNLEQTVAEIGRVYRKLREELAVIRLRRIVPGRCKYCPL